MLFDMHVLENYIHNKQIPKADAWFYQYTNGYCACADHRQDVALALSDQMTDLILRFPYFNQNCIEQLFKDELPFLHQVIIMPILGAAPSFDSDIIEYEGNHYFLIDILNIADYSIRLNEMQYILQNQISLQFIRYMIHLRYPLKEHYQGVLEDAFFCDGMAQFLSWNEDCKNYPFQEPAYQKKKMNADVLLHKFYFSEDLPLQKKVLKLLKEVNLWNQFPVVYGLFFFHEEYMAKQEKGLCDRYAQGPHLLYDVMIK